ncbi:MAG TPA: peptidoglycan DD-metalloendopeptidase family protein [Thermodesulfobacteriota bacterium]|nr:peptidoglycan DD-metalloendopeptidase family protein [Thermodesulfobacteriota bacterium]
MNLVFGRLNQPKFKKGSWTPKRKWMVFSGALLCSLLFLFYFVLLPPEFFTPAKGPTPQVISVPKEPLSQEPPYEVIEGKVKKGSSFFKSLAERKIPVRWIEMIISKLKPYVNFKKIRGGTYRFITDVKGELVRFVYEAGPTEVYEIERKEQGYSARKKEVPLQVSVTKVVGEIHSSLFEAMDAIGEQDQLTIPFAEVLASEVDFYKDVKEGDRFKVVVEKVYKGNEFIRYGTILAVEYQRSDKTIRGIRYQDDYYDENGNCLRKAFLKAPLRFNRISSRFNRARNHPILGGVRPHYGVDYAAPPGTPIWAVADGTVLSCGWASGFGKQVILRHGNGYTTCYGHLSKYGPGIRTGTRVRQKQVIGYVGSTGLSTGPHLDYRLAKDGKFRNPLKEAFPAGVPLRREEIRDFEKRKGEILPWLHGSSSSEWAL